MKEQGDCGLRIERQGFFPIVARGLGPAQNKKQFVVLDGQAGPEYEEIGIPVFRPDGTLEYRIVKKNGKLVRVKHVPVKK